MRKLEGIVPAAVSFGPMFIAIGSSWHGWLGQVESMAGALFLGLGIGVMYRLICDQRREIASLREQVGVRTAES